MPTSHDHALQIAAHTNAVLRSMRERPAAANELYAAWQDYARSNRVCVQIREHMAYARAECEREARANAPPRTDHTKRMTGDRE